MLFVQKVIISALLTLCVRNPLVGYGSSHKGPVMSSFDLFFFLLENIWMLQPKLL